MKQALWGLVMALAGCIHAPIVSSPLEGPGDPSHGDVTALSKHLAGKTDAVVIFVHGVGDHCPGYALSPTFGWLKDGMLPAIGLKPDGPPVVADIPVTATVERPNIKAIQRLVHLVLNKCTKLIYIGSSEGWRKLHTSSISRRSTRSIR